MKELIETLIAEGIQELTINNLNNETKINFTISEYGPLKKRVRFSITYDFLIGQDPERVQDIIVKSLISLKQQLNNIKTDEPS